MIPQLIEQIKKNLKLLYRSKTSGLIILLGPIFIILLVGIAFSSKGLHGVQLGVYNHGDDKTVNSVLESIKDAGGFTIVEAVSVEECINDVKDAKTHICVEFPAKIELSDEPANITFHVDYSKVNLVFVILSTISKKIKDESGELTTDYTQQLLNKIEQTSDQIQQKTGLIVELAEEGRSMAVQINKIQTDIDKVETATGDDIDIKKFQDFTTNADRRVSQMDEIIRTSFDENRKGLEEMNEAIAQISAGTALQLQAQEELKEEYNDTFNTNCAVISAVNQNICSLLNESIGAVDSSIEELHRTQLLLGDLIDDLEKSKKTLNNKENQLEDLQGQTKRELDDINAEIDKIKIKIDDIKEKVEEAENLKNNTKNEISSIQTTLDQNIQKIDDIQKSINDILNNLKNNKVTRAHSIVNPISTRIDPLIVGKRYLDYTFSVLLILVTMFMSILLSSTIVMSEKESSAFFRNNIAPVKSIIFNLSTYLTNLIVVFFQVLSLIVIAMLVFNVNIGLTFPSIMLIVLLVASVFICIGMIIGYIFTTEETSTLAAISMTCIFLLFSSTLIPIESLSPTIGTIARFSPFVIGEALTRKMIVFGTHFEFSLGVFLLLIEFIIIAAIVSFSTWINKRRIR